MRNETQKRGTVGGRPLGTLYDWKANAVQQIGVWLARRYTSAKDSFNGMSSV